MNRITSNFPTYDAMLIPTLRALQELGGSGSNNEIRDKVAEIIELKPELAAFPHGNGTQTEFEYRLAWSRTYLKKFGLIDNANSPRGVWALISGSIDVSKYDPKEIVRFVRQLTDPSNQEKASEIEIIANETEDAVLIWHEEMHSVLLKLTPDAFERLAQRLLRESGFIRVEVTGKTGDGGIDGIGIARIAGFLSFQVLFQCKRYQGAVTPSQIRDFRGAMQGRTDKGLFITTGTFTREAVKEATRDGAPPIDLIDGDLLVSRLKELGLGVSIKLVESVEIDHEWFQRI